MMGCSNPHPHGQIWSMSDIPSLPSKELQSLSSYASSQSQLAAPESNSCLLCDYAVHEASNSSGERIVAKNDHWIALVPYWATWPFEVMRMSCIRHFSICIWLMKCSPALSPTHSFNIGVDYRGDSKFRKHPFRSDHSLR